MFIVLEPPTNGMGKIIKFFKQEINVKFFTILRLAFLIVNYELTLEITIAFFTFFTYLISSIYSFLEGIDLSL